jgi:hypothetical protein
MPELYAALTDLLAPDADAVEGLPRLPLGERLLSRAECRPAPPDWRRWALGLAGLDPPAGDLPIGRTLAAHQGHRPGEEATWFVATPVHLVAGLTRLQFHARGALTLPPGAAAALAARFTTDWADPTLALVEAGEALLLRAAGRFDVATVDPARYAGRDVGEALPGGADAGRLERLMTELQMWLHGRPPASAEGLPVNALWLWGAGHAPLAGAAEWPALDGGDAFLAAATAVVPGTTGRARFESWSLAALAREGRAFAESDARWFGPLAAALRSGALDAARLHVGGQEFVLRPRQRWRYWVRPRPWWELFR